MPSVMRDLSVHQEHELLLKLEAAGLDSSLASGIINSKDNLQAKQVVAFLKNGCKFVIQKVMKFLSYTCAVEVAPVKEFTVGDFYQTGKERTPMYFVGDNFTNWILNPMKKMKLSFTAKTLLHKFLLKKDSHDTEMQSDFAVGSPIIPVRKFMAQLKAMVEAQPRGEAKEDGLYNSGKANIFNVDLSGIGDKRVVAVNVHWSAVGWRLDASPLDCDARYEGDSFFSPVIG